VADEPVPTRDEAIDVVRADRAHTLELIERIAPNALTLPGLGGGEWSPKDLLGHLESWEEHALGSLDAWERGEEPPVGHHLRTIGTDELNRREVERKKDRSLEDTWASVGMTHERLLDRFAALSDARWGEPAGAGDEVTVGERLGGVLGGQLGGFRHDPDHWDELEAFGRDHPA
jgi:DinB superfamily